MNIRLTPLLHRNAECIGIYFDNDITIEKIIRRQPAVKWSQTNKCWYLLYNKEHSYNQAMEAEAKTVKPKVADKSV